MLITYQGIPSRFFLPVNTPDTSWNGEWDDENNIIIRGDDIPMIKKTQPPLQTDYVKTEVPKVVIVVNISS